ncbi:DUF2653 family protein [Effusibacillus pohliae]|uniref:DUF2653 family protein n=1 Tax=Effusibacillus pohliae TaxID=232270 RepID=UPI00037E5274|nr:DUF2653 family protein [Effusibacillus pohliae]
MKLCFNEQDLIDSVCVFTAWRYEKRPEQVQAELFYEEGKGFSATASVDNGLYKYPISEQDLIDGVAIYLRDYHNFDPQRLLIELFFEEGKGFSAEIEVR